MQMWFAGEYREVVENRRLVYTEAMSDERGNIRSEQSAAPGHPDTTEVRVDFEPLGDVTRIVLTHVGIPADSPGAAGWEMAFTKLTALVAAQPAG
jgi:uncharacterized protein YndB with AHSA1/START domain